MEYQETFLKGMKSFLPYFIEFQDDGTILLKEYPEDCAIGWLNRQLIIMITYDKSTFSANDSRPKVWTLKRHRIL